MNKNFLKFSFFNYFIRFGIIELLLIIGSYFAFPTLTVILFFIFLFQLLDCVKQTITLDPFTIEKYYYSDDATDSSYEKKVNKYYHIYEVTNFKIGFLFITIYGDIDYRKKVNDSGHYTEKIKKVNKARIYRTLGNEEELIKLLKQKNKS